jgi:hypothetical protein
LAEFTTDRENKKIAAIEDLMDRLLGIPVNPGYKEATSLQKRPLKQRDSIPTFLHYFNVPH